MTARVVTLKEIEKVLSGIDVVGAMEQAFVAYSRGLAVVPPVGEMLFEDPPGDLHLKYGYLKGDEVFVVKLATGFYDNPKKGLPPNSGMMLVFDLSNGLPKAVLLDEGHLTNVRTAAAGAVSAKYLGPHEVEAIGVLGTGLQARMQAEYLKPLTPCRDLYLWGRREDAAILAAKDLTDLGFKVEVLASPKEVAARANLLVTTTASQVALLDAGDVRPGTHITAMGSDTESKRELTGKLMAKADLLVADSIPQSRERGEIHMAMAEGAITGTTVVELGAVISGDVRGRTKAEQITIADLTGVAVQDIAISKAVLAGL